MNSGAPPGAAYIFSSRPGLLKLGRPELSRHGSGDRDEPPTNLEVKVGPGQAKAAATGVLDDGERVPPGGAAGGRRRGC